MFQNLTIQEPKFGFALLALSCAYIVHAHISHRVGQPFLTFIVGRRRKVNITSWLENKNTVNKISNQVGEFGDRVVFGEIFSILVLCFSVLLAIDSLVDFIPDANTVDIITNMTVDYWSISSDQYTAIRTFLPILATVVTTSILFTFTVLFYILNSDRITDRSHLNPDHIGASGRNMDGAPTHKLEGVMDNKVITDEALQATATKSRNSLNVTAASLEFNSSEFAAAHKRIKLQAETEGLSLIDFCELEVYRRNGLPLPPKGDGSDAKFLVESLTRE